MVLSRRGFIAVAGALGFSALTVGQAAAQASAPSTLSLAVGQRGNWDTSVAELGQRAGIFEKHGLKLEILYTQGGGETLQAVLSGSVDIGVAAGIMGTLSAFSKGAPVRILGAETTGGADLYWYTRSDSPIDALSDIDGQTIAYSTNGSSTHGVVTAFISENDLDAEPVATGGPSATLTAVMSGQIDIGWAAPPFGLDLLEKGDIKIIASGSDAEAFRGQTVRLLVTNVESLETQKDQLDRFMTAYRETVDWMYNSEEAIDTYAEFVGVPRAIALRTRDEFFPKEALDPDEVVGLDVIVPGAVELDYTEQELTDEQLSEVIQIPPRR